MAAWLLASAQVTTEGVSVPDYATILFGVSGVLGATILFFERVSHHYPPRLSSRVDRDRVSVSLPIES